MGINGTLFGIMGIYEGTFKNNKLILSNLHNGTGFKTENGTFNSQLTFEKINNKEIAIFAKGSNDQGKTWKPLLKGKLTRK